MSARREFTPHPGSVADRAIAYLQSQPAKGAEVSSPALAEAIGVPAAHLSVSLEQARDRGAVFARRKGGHLRSPLFWSLVDHSAKHGRTGEAFSPANGSQKPDGAAAIPCVKAGRETPQKGANRDASAEQSHGAEGSESPTGRGDNVAPALGAAPVFIPEGLASQHVLKAEAARPDATDRDVPANASPVGGPMGAGQPAAAGPAGIRIALWSDGTLQIERPDAVGGAAALVLFSADETRALVRYLDRTLIANTEEITP